jgi:hypothetical protein
MLECVFRKRIRIFHNLQPEQIFEELVNFKFPKFSNLFKAISLTLILKKIKITRLQKLIFKIHFQKFGCFSKRCIILYPSVK